MKRYALRGHGLTLVRLELGGPLLDGRQYLSRSEALGDLEARVDLDAGRSCSWEPVLRKRGRDELDVLEDRKK